MSFNKKLIYLFGSFIPASGFFLSIYYINSQCKTRITTCTNFSEYVWMYTLIFVPVFVVSFITYFIKEEIFFAWKKFTSLYLPGYLVAIIITPWQGEAFFRIEKGTVAIFLCVTYAVISLILIAYKYFTLRRDVASK